MYSVKIWCLLILNIILTLGSVLLNKWIFSQKVLSSVTLSTIQLIIVFIGLCVCEKFNIFNTKSVDVSHIVLLAVLFTGCVVFTNLSLEYNSVVTFQTAKMLSVCGVTLIQMLVYKKHFGPAMVTVVPIIGSIILCIYCDVQYTGLGTTFAVLGIVLTCLYQLLLNLKQTEIQMDAMQLLYYQAPLSALFLCPYIPYELRNWHSRTCVEWLLVIISGLLALFGNLTTFLIIEKISTLTYNISSHIKLILVILCGWYAFDEKIVVYQWVGLAVLLFGFILYTNIKSRPIDNI